MNNASISQYKDLSPEERSRKRNDFQREIVMLESDLRKKMVQKKEVENEIRYFKKQEARIRSEVQAFQEKLRRLEQDIAPIEIEIKKIKKEINLI